MRNRRRQRGIALIVALWGGAILAVVVMSVLQLTRADARLTRGIEDVAALNAVADAAVNMTILAMLGPPPTRPTVNTGPATVTFAGVDVQVSLMDEVGKIDLNLAGVPALRQMAAVSGMGTAQAQLLADQIVAWRTATAGGHPFQSIEALALVPGMTPGVYRRMAPMLTVYSQSPWIDPSYASLEALNTFRSFDTGADAAWRRLVEERTGLRAPTQKPTVILGHAFSITAVAAAGGARVTRTAVIRLTGHPTAPVLVYRWN